MLLLAPACLGWAAAGIASTPVRSRVPLPPRALERSWDSIKSALDETVPAFVITDGESSPLQLERDGLPTLLCFASPGSAQAALVGASSSYSGLRLQAVGLGTALERVREGRAMLVPAPEDLATARGANPEGEDWDGGALPLFGCHQMKRQRSDGTLATPLYLSVDDAKGVLAEADPEREQGLHLVCTSLQSMVELIMQGEVGDMDFVPSRRAVEFCTTGTLTGAVVGEMDELPPGVTKGAVLRALPEIFGDGEDAKKFRGSGLFPGF